MWILECDGDILQKKRVWLRPGKKYLFGRTNPEGGRKAGFAIQHKSVSRKHLTLAVSAVKPGEGSSLYIRSVLSLEDENTKVGTVIDGERIRGGKKILTQDSHTFRLGSFEHLFRIIWQPVVFSFTLPSKDVKEDKDPLLPARSRLEDLDIKTVLPYVVGQTTHVIASKRNTAKCLQALINGKHIVDNSYIDAVTYATTPGNLDEPESLSPLEEDYDRSWPRAEDHLPALNGQSSQRDPSSFAPDAGRQDIFAGYTFVFFDRRQFENLQPPINQGKGKALCHEIKHGVTTTRQLVRFLKDAAGETGDREFESHDSDGGVVFVRFPASKGHEGWAVEVQKETCRTLGQRIIEQNEFLDAILTKNPSQLRRPLLAETIEGGAEIFPATDGPYVVDDASDMSASPPPAERSEHPEAAEPVVVPYRRTRTRGTVVRAFEGFDDGWDPSQLTKHQDSMPTRVRGVGEEPSRALLNGTQAEVQPDQNHRPNKRPLSPDPMDEEVDRRLLPAAAAMKKRRIEEEKDARRRGIDPPNSKRAAAQKSAMPPKPRRREREIDIEDALRERREADEEEAKLDQQAMREALDEMTAEEMKRLAVVEELDVQERDTQPIKRQYARDRWDERWNGRKNFKKFRRQGEGPGPRRGQTVIVPLEEARRKQGRGIGHHYYLESERSAGRRRRQEPERTSENGPYEDREASASQTFTSAHSQQEEVPSELVEGSGLEVVDVDAPRTTRRGGRQAQTVRSTAQSTVGSRKRGASRSVVSEATKPAKKQRTFAVQDNSESEDDMKFRFRRKA